MNEKQQQLTFDKGITNVPSDALCSDNTLKDCVGMVYDNGEHRPIQVPEQFMTVNGVKVLFIHTPNSDTENYIVIDDDSQLRWGEKDSNDELVLNQQVLLTGLESIDFQVMSIGKTLIVNKSDGVSYFTWKGGSYIQLQSNIPDIDIDFQLTDFRLGDAGDGESTRHVFKISGNNPIPEFDPDYGGNQGAYNDVVVGVYYERKKATAREKRFIGPFFVRAAIKMYDGSYTKMTAPFLMVPTMNYNSQIVWSYSYGNNSLLQLRMLSCKLQYKLNTDYSDYSDLVTDIVLFVSEEVETINIQGDAHIPGTDARSIITIYKANDSNCRARHIYTPETHTDIESEMGHISEETMTGYNVLVPRSANDINADIAETSLFYKLAEIGVDNNSTWQEASDKIRDNVMENLTTQERLTDEYFGHSVLSSDYAYVYNSRLNLANVRRTIFEGYDKMLAYDWYHLNTEVYPTNYQYHVIVTVETNDGAVSVEKTFVSSERIGMWFYYPDSRAKRVRIYTGDITHQLIVDETLKEHTGLNGAYYFAGLPVDGDYDPTGQPSTLPDVTPNPVEELSNSIVTSEVNNPYIFNASGYNQAGEGTVIAVISNTQALSQGQFGQFPLVIFTTKGIWAMDTDNTGLFVTSKPLSREVCNNAKSVTQTDSAIYFSSEKGLMILYGSTVKCTSEQLNGKNSFNMDFNTFLQGSQIAYDYRDSLLWIGREDSEMYWVYSIKSGTFHRYLMSMEEQAARRSGATNVIFNFINDYPDSLIQINNRVFSLMQRPNINADTNTYDGFLETRPMKLENALALKSIMQIRHILQFHPYTADGVEKKGTMTLRIFASNNLDNWVELHSLRGTPWKYYKFRYDFKDMKATDRFAGTMLITQERRSNKLR